MVKTYKRDGYTVTLDYTDEHPTVTYGDGPTHRLHNDQHAADVALTLKNAGYTEDSDA